MSCVPCVTYILQDFKTICDYVDRETYLVGLVRARRECFESWSILLCVIAESCPADSFSYPILPTYFLHVMRLLTNKVRKFDVSAGVTALTELFSAAVWTTGCRFWSDISNTLRHYGCLCSSHWPIKNIPKFVGYFGSKRLCFRSHQNGLQKCDHSDLWCASYRANTEPHNSPSTTK